MIQFCIEHWRAWAPGLHSEDDWRAWSARPFVAIQDDAHPDVSFLPALQRRRLSPLARMAMQVAWPLAEGHERLPLIFASRHGETPRTYALLRDLAQGEPLSPTQFSLSVHNAIIGQWSILRGDTSEMTALAAEGDGFEQAVLEATGLLAEGAPAVLLVVAEERPPEIYQPFIHDVPFSYSMALLLTPGDQWQLLLDPQAPEQARTAWPHALDFLRVLLNGQPNCQHQWKQRKWNWRRKPA